MERGKSEQYLGIVAYPQSPIKTTYMSDRSILHTNFHGAVDATRQAIKDRFDKDDLKQLVNVTKCLIGAINKETLADVNEKLTCISDLVN